MPTTITAAVMTAEPPTLTNLRKLNSSPKENNRTIIPISDHMFIFAKSDTVEKMKNEVQLKNRQQYNLKQPVVLAI